MRAFLTVIFAVCVTAVSAQKISPATTPEAAGFSSERLKRIDDVLQNFVSDQWVNGGVALVIRNNKIVYHKAFGYDDPSTKELFAKDDIFRIASQTKAITSVAVMMLME